MVYVRNGVIPQPDGFFDNPTEHDGVNLKFTIDNERNRIWLNNNNLDEQSYAGGARKTQKHKKPKKKKRTKKKRKTRKLKRALKKGTIKKKKYA